MDLDPDAYLERYEYFRKLINDSKDDPTDKDLLDYLDFLSCNEETGVTMRLNNCNEWRLKQSHRKRASKSVREAILDFMVSKLTLDTSKLVIYKK